MTSSDDVGPEAAATDSGRPPAAFPAGVDSRFGLGRLALRQLRVDLGPVLLVGVLVAVLSALLSAAPSLVRSLADTEIRQALTRSAPMDRSIVQDFGPAFLTDLESDTPEKSGWGPFVAQLEEFRQSFPAQLLAVSSPPQIVASTGPRLLDQIDPKALQHFVKFTSDLHLTDHLSLDSGRWPKAASNPERVEIVMGRTAAADVGWRLGATRTSTSGDGFPQKYVLVGLLATDPQDPDYTSVVSAPTTSIRFDDGNQPATLTVNAYVADGDWAQVSFGYLARMSTKVWFPLRTEAITAASAATLSEQIRRVTAKSFTAIPPNPNYPSATVTFDSSVPGILDGALGRASAAGAVQWIALSGPIGAALAVLALGLQALARRRRPAAALLVDRGAAPGQQARSLALQGFVVGLVGVAAGVGVLVAVASWQIPWWAIAIGGIGALVPAVVLPTLLRPARLRDGRDDLGGRGGRGRLVVEIILLLLTAVGIAVLLGGADQPGRPDVLVVVTPILAVLTVCALTVRLYPLPLLALRALTRRGRALVAHFGLTRSLRDPSAGLPLIVACLSGVAVASFSLIVLATVRQGAEDASVRVAGSDLTVTGLNVVPGVLDLARSIPGVRDAAPVGFADTLAITSADGKQLNAPVYFTDAAHFAAVQRDVPGSPAISQGMTAEGGPLPIIVSRSVADRMASPAVIDDTAATVLGVGSYLPTVYTRDWVLVDSSRITELVRNRTIGTTMLISLEPGADVAAVQRDLVAGIPKVDAAMITDVTGQPVNTIGFTDRASILNGLSSAPSISGMREVLVGVVAASGVLTLLAVVVIAVAGNARRVRLIAVLRLLGLRRGQGAGIVAWEQGPPAVTAVLVGGAFGVVLGWLTHLAIDLRPFTGDTEQPPLVIDVGGIALLVGAFAAAVLLAVAVTAVIAGRVSATSVLRAEE